MAKDGRLGEFEDADGGAEEEGLAFKNVNVPEASGGIERKRFGEDGEEPVEKVHVGGETDEFEVEEEVGKDSFEESFEKGDVLLKFGFHFVESHVNRSVEKVGETSESGKVVQVEKEDGSEVRHALNVANVRSIANISVENAMQFRMIGTTFLVEGKSGEGPGKVNTDQFRRLQLPLLLCSFFSRLLSCLRLLHVYIKQILRYMKLIAHQKRPHFCSHKRRYPLLHHLMNLLRPLLLLPLSQYLR